MLGWMEHHIAPAVPVDPPALIATLSDGTRVKRRQPRMRACDETNDKGKRCHGHLKRWFAFGAEVQERFGKNAEVYRCEHCRTLYLPHPEETPRTRTLAW